MEKQLPQLVDLDAVTLEERRVLIAKDVISVLDSRRLTPTDGIYVFPSDIHPDIGQLSADELRSVLTSPPRNCSVCALGASLISLVRVFNQLDGRTFAEDGIEQLRDRMGITFASFVEGAFEGWGVEDEHGDEWAPRYSKRCYQPRKHLREIMRTIIASEGDEQRFRDVYFGPPCA